VRHGGDMSYGNQERKPLLNYSESEERASLFQSEDSMPPGRKRRSKSKKGKRKYTGLKGVKFIKGKVALRISGYKGISKLSASDLVRYIPLAKLRAAGKKILGKSKKSKKRRIKKKGKRRSQRRLKK
jgi:hypothetical protein